MPEGSDVPATGSVRRKLGARAEAGSWSVQGPQVLGGSCSVRGPQVLRGGTSGLCRVPRSLGGFLVCAGSLGPGGGGRVLVCVGSESSRKLALTRRGTARLCPGALVCAMGLCVAPVSTRMRVHQARWPGPQGESRLHVRLQVLVWVSCKTGHLAGEPVSGRSAGVSPVDVAPRTPRTLGVSTALVAGEVPACPSSRRASRPAWCWVYAAARGRPHSVRPSWPPCLLPVSCHRRCRVDGGPRVPGSADPWRLGRALMRPRRRNRSAAVGSAAGVWRGARPGVWTGGQGCGDLSWSGVAVGVASDYMAPVRASLQRPLCSAGHGLRATRPRWLSAHHRLQGHGQSSFCLLLLCPSRHGREPGDPPSLTAGSGSELGPGPQEGRGALLPICSQPAPQPFRGSRAASAALLPAWLRGEVAQRPLGFACSCHRTRRASRPGETPQPLGVSVASQSRPAAPVSGLPRGLMGILMPVSFLHGLLSP